MNEEKAESNAKGMNTKVLVVAAVLVLLVVFSGVQAMELTALKNQINTELDDLTTLSTSSNGATVASTSSDLQKNLQNLPSMVGGC